MEIKTDKRELLFGNCLEQMDELIERILNA